MNILQTEWCSIKISVAAYSLGCSTKWKPIMSMSTRASEKGVFAWWQKSTACAMSGRGWVLLDGEVDLLSFVPKVVRKDKSRVYSMVLVLDLDIPVQHTFIPWRKGHLPISYCWLQPCWEQSCQIWIIEQTVEIMGWDCQCLWEMGLG
jgi:hypothetical protein